MGDREPGALAFVLAVWLACAAGALGLAAAAAAETPLWDDWANVPVLTGNRPVTARWLWSQHNEHRVPLPRLVLVGLSKVTGVSFRAPAFLNAAMLAMASGALVLAARRRRGWTSYTDAFLPLLLCGPAHERNILVGFHVQLILSTALYAVALSLIVRRPEGLSTASSVVMAVVVLLLPLCGANGVALVPALALAMLVQAFIDRRRSARRAAVLSLGAVAGLALVLAYFQDWKAIGHSDATAPTGRRLWAVVQFLAGGLGNAAVRTWPWSGWVVAALLAGGLAALAIGWRHEPEGRVRTMWLVAAAGAIGSLALGLGWARAGMSEQVGFETRYVTLAAPALATAYLAWFGAGPPARRSAQMTMFALACLVTWPNAEAMIDAARAQRSAVLALKEDIALGLPPYRLISRHIGFLHNSHDELQTGLALLKRAGLGMYRSMADDPPFREVKLSVEPTVMIGMTGSSGVYRADIIDPYLVYDIKEPGFVAGIRLRYRHANAEGLPGRFAVLWKRKGQASGDPPIRHSIWTLPTGEERTITVWLNSVISRFAIQPDNKPCDFEVRELTVLVPAVAPRVPR